MEGNEVHETRCVASLLGTPMFMPHHESVGSSADSYSRKDSSPPLDLDGDRALVHVVPPEIITSVTQGGS